MHSRFVLLGTHGQTQNSVFLERCTSLRSRLLRVASMALLPSYAAKGREEIYLKFLLLDDLQLSDRGISSISSKVFQQNDIVISDNFLVKNRH